MKKYKVVFTINDGLTVTLKQVFLSWFHASVVAGEYWSKHEKIKRVDIKEVD